MRKNRTSIKSQNGNNRSEGRTKIEKSSYDYLRAGPKRLLFLSFKNKILISTLLVVVGGVVVVAATLQFAVFPMLEGDPATITKLKIIHLIASLVVIVISWVFIELISKKITLPLLELTSRADQISREAGKSLASGPYYESEFAVGEPPNGDGPAKGDEIAQLKTSFYRMLAHLRASESRLRESKDKYRFLIDNGPSSLFVVEAEEMTIVDVNDRAEEEYGYSREEFLGKSFTDLGLPEERDRIENTYQKLAPKEVCVIPVLQHNHKDGAPFLVHLHARMSLYNGSPAIIAATWDVTKRMEQEALVVQAGKMATLGEMATGIAHELNQPLNVIKIGADFLLKSIKKGRAVSDEDLLRTASEMGDNVDRASLIIGHLRAFGRKAEGTMNPIDVNRPVRDVLTLLGTQLRKAGIKCELLLNKNLPFIMGDENRLEQVFINLVLNARDAMMQLKEESGEEGRAREFSLKIKSFRERDRVVVTVSDTGPGIPPSVKAKVFEPFFTTKKVGDGTGLGLSISYGIIKEHSGTIEVDGQEEGGATFRLTFPALDRSAETDYDQSPDCRR